MNFLILMCFSETTAVLLIVDLRKRKHILLDSLTYNVVVFLHKNCTILKVVLVTERRNTTLTSADDFTIYKS